MVWGRPQGSRRREEEDVVSVDPIVWEQFDLGRIRLPHRLAMAPMTRNRAEPDGTPGPLVAQYYEQRASLGLLITEGTQPSEDGQGYLNTPGIYTQAHIEGWREVADRVHAGGGRLFIQLMHAGRVSHPSMQPGGTPACPSARAVPGPGAHALVLIAASACPSSARALFGSKK